MAHPSTPANPARALWRRNCRVGLRATLVLVLAQPLAACEAVEDAAVDFDGDGALDSADCAPEDAAVHPGAEDPAGDGIDGDCDGADGTDADGDGAPLRDVGGDCNDADGSVHPGATEIAGDGVDQDCDGEDQLCDGDFDGHEGPQCSGSDCADGDPKLHPGAAEVPDDGVDQDCSGADLACDADGDGAPGSSPGCAGGDCDDANPQHFPGTWADAVGDGVDENCDGEEGVDLSAASFALTLDGTAPPTGALILRGLNVGDRADLVLGYPGPEPYDVEGTVVGVPASALQGTADRSLASTMAGSLLAPSGVRAFGSAVHAGPGSTVGGRAIVVSSYLGGESDGPNAPLVQVPAEDLFTPGSATAAPAWTLSPESDSHALGFSVEGGIDLDDDGLGDWVVADPLYAPAGEPAGRIYLYLGSTLALWDGAVAGGDAHATFDVEPGVFPGFDLAILPDLDGDGLDELVVTSRIAGEAEDGMTAAWVLDGASLLAGGSLGPEDAILRITTPADVRDRGVEAAILDVDGDSVGDLCLVTGANRDGDRGGAACWTRADMEGGGTLGWDEAWARLAGSASGVGTFGAAILAVDADVDGRLDLAIFAAGDGWMEEGSGTLWIFGADALMAGGELGPPQSFGQVGPIWEDETAHIASGGDLGGDGYGDFVFWDVEARPGVGAVLVVRGPGR